jgi:hypothetical protein
MNWPKENKEVVDGTRRLLQNCQLSKKIPAIYITGYLGFLAIIYLFILSAISCGIRNDFSRNPGSETLVQTVKIKSYVKLVHREVWCLEGKFTVQSVKCTV